MRRALLILILCGVFGFLAYRVMSPPETATHQNEYERRCRYLGHNDPTDLKNCIWAHTAQEMGKWRQVDWERWQALSGATADEVLRQRAAVWAENERQKIGSR